MRFPTLASGRVLALAACSAIALCGDALGAQGARSDLLLDDVRSKLRLGMLQEAEDRLRDIPPDSSQLTQAIVALLSGNLAYERGDYSLAVSKYSLAESLYMQVSPDDTSAVEGARVARQNEDLALEQLERRSALERRSTWLRVLTVGVAAFAVVLVTLLGRKRSASIGESS